MNTKFRYLYRDASNYKKFGEVIFLGNPCEVYVDRLRAAFQEQEFFIASQVRIQEKFPWQGKYAASPDDHCWHEFDGFEETREDPTDEFSRSIRRFVEEVELAAIKGWKEFDPHTHPGNI